MLKFIIGQKITNALFTSQNVQNHSYLHGFIQEHLFLTLSWRRPISYRNQSIDLLCKSVDWFLYDIGLRHERVKSEKRFPGKLCCYQKKLSHCKDHRTAYKKSLNFSNIINEFNNDIDLLKKNVWRKLSVEISIFANHTIILPVCFSIAHQIYYHIYHQIIVIAFLSLVLNGLIEYSPPLTR